MTCDILDFRCVVVNDLIGSASLALMIAGIFFFAYASYNKIGFKTTLWFSVAYFPVMAYFISGGIFLYAIMTLLVALGIALLHTRLTGNR